MSILNIKERFAQRILKSDNQSNEHDFRPTCDAKSFTKPSINEADVGITEYLLDLPGYDAVIKQRYSDFNVHEIDLDGNLVYYNNLDLPDESIGDGALETKLIDNVTAEKLEELVADNSTLEVVSIDVTEFDKDNRKSVHQFIKAKYGSLVVSNTVDTNEKKIINVNRNENGKSDNRRAGHLPKFLHFSLTKSNMDTMHALSVLGNKLKVKVNQFGIAGTKDKRANTTQRVSLKGAYASKLGAVSLRGLAIGNYEYKDKGLELGALKGNNFQIALRGVMVSDGEVDLAMNKLKENGFINYFGMQRFGNCAESPTHEVGKLLIKESYGQAVEMILKPRGDYEATDLKSARDIWAKSKDASQALNALRNTRSIEAKLFLGLKKHGPTAYVNALDMLPRNMRLLYLHAYQSFLWNKVVSKRIKEYGTKVLEGDLVLVDEVPEVPIEEEFVNDTDLDDELNVKPLEKPCPVRNLLSSELLNFTINDIVLPLPGTTVIYPKNKVSEWYHSFLIEDGLTTDSFTSKVKQYSLGGSYRKIIAKPENVSWKMVNYEKPEDDLILSDLDIIEGKTLPAGNGTFRAVVLSMDLTPSTYATMGLREILRADTSSAHQAKLNNFVEKRPATGQNVEVMAKKLKTEES